MSKIIIENILIYFRAHTALIIKNKLYNLHLIPNRKRLGLIRVRHQQFQNYEKTHPSVIACCPNSIRKLFRIYHNIDSIFVKKTTILNLRRV